MQAKCDCASATAQAEGSCATCDAEPTLALQPALLPGHDFCRIRVNAATRSGTLADRSDPLELEADRTAEQVLRRLAALPDPGAPAAPVATSTAPLHSMPRAEPALQRQADPDEGAADAAADAALAGPELEAAPPGDDDAGAANDDDDAGDAGDAVQADGPASAGASVGGRLRESIDRSRGGGQPLPGGLRSGLETVFGADFAAVRIHADAQAAALAGSIHARAFATGRDIYFGAGHYDTQSETGRRLLAHELTHVLQQGAAPSTAPAPLARAPLDTVQRDPDPTKPKRELVGEFHYFDAKGDTLRVIPATQNADFGIRPGYYEVTVTLIPGSQSHYDVRVKGVGEYEVASSNPTEFAKLVKRADRVFLLVYGKAGTAVPGEARDKPSADDPTGPAAPPGAQPPTDEQKPGGAGGQPDAGKGEQRDDKPGGGSGTGKQDGKGGSGTGADKDKDQGAGLPGEKKGSKMGVFGFLDLPQPLIDFMESALEVLGDSAEMQAMSDSLLMLKELAEHRDALGDLFKDADTLIEIALGLKDNAAISAIEAWANKEVKPSKAGAGVKHKGIARLAAKLVATAAKLRKVLKPIFKVRSTVQSAVGGVGLLLEAVPALESLLSIAADPSKLSDLDIEAAVDDFAVDFAAQIKLKLDFAPKALKAGIEKFAESDLVSYEELAAAVTAAVLTLVPKQYKPAVKVGKELGIDRAISDNVIAPLIPKEALDGVNDVLRSLIALVEPTLESAADTMQKIVDDLAPGFLAELPAEVRKVIKPSRHGRGPARRSSARAIAGLVQRSHGTPLDEDTRGAAETSMGELFGGVRVHTDGAAQQASERLGANAFAIGNDVYFGPGRFDPASQGGRRLLYHELAHTAQQQQRGGIGLQPDYKELLKRLAKRFSASVIAELRGASTTSPAKQKQIEDIKDKVEKLIGRKVESRDRPKLPTGYMYIPNDKGKIQTIRRAVAWIRFLPALTIDSKTRKIKLAATLSRFDPKAPMRRALRASLGCTGKQEAHHLIPLELYFHPVVETAKKNGFRFNGGDNGLCISDKIHAGSHPVYTGGVRNRLDSLKLSFGADWGKLQKPFEALIESLRADLKKRRSKLA
ncbi:MAG: DUF4157 domain-containing protein [Myxococcales bacterium]|nr:DUF4157 domain-containing protein [Myxococcales bacterium]